MDLLLDLLEAIWTAFREDDPEGRTLRRRMREERRTQRRERRRHTGG